MTSDVATARGGTVVGGPALWMDLKEISKPRIIPLLVVVAWAAMFVASAGWPGLRPFLVVTVIGIASVAASGAWNHIYEKDRDSVMKRTADRPIASGRLPVRVAATYGSIMTLVAVVTPLALGWYLTAALTAGAILYYVFVYTVWLKPATPQNIVIGGFAGSFPALIGWAAVTHQIGVPAMLLAFIVFLWTPPHFWALALLYKDDYAAADYPMMPIIHGEERTRKLMLYYAVATVVVSLMLIPFGGAGWLYLGAAALLGYYFVVRCFRLLKEHGPKRYRSYFFYSIQYLGLLCFALIGDRLLQVPGPLG